MSLEIVNKVDYKSLYNLFSTNQYLFNDYYREIICKESFIKEKIEYYISNDSKIVKFLIKDNDLQGLYTLEWLGWDSRVFSKNMWKMDLIMKSNILDDINVLETDFVRECEKNKINHISCKVKSRDYISTQILERLGFKIVDSIIRFGVNLQEYKLRAEKDNSILIRDYEEGDYEQLLTLTKEAFSNYPNRFLNDGVFSQDQCENMYLEWIKNSTKGFADSILIAEKKGQIVGFSTIKYKKPLYQQDVTIAERQLSGISKNSRGLGLNTRILTEQLQSASKCSNFFEVGTQVYNYISQKTYYKCGLKPFDSYFSFHLNI